MEIKTCEQYVLAQLEEAQRYNAELEDKLRCLGNKLLKATAEPDHITLRVAEIGRRMVFEEWFYAFTRSNAQSFEEFCEENVSYARPDDISKKAAIRFFKPELLELWDRIQARRKAEEEDE